MRAYVARATVLKSLTYRLAVRPLRTTAAASVAVPAVPRPWPRQSGCTHTPWICPTDGDCDPTSALHTTRPRPPRPAAPVATPAVADARVDADFADEHVDGRPQIRVEFVGANLPHSR